MVFFPCMRKQIFFQFDLEVWALVDHYELNYHSQCRNTSLEPLSRGLFSMMGHLFHLLELSQEPAHGKTLGWTDAQCSHTWFQMISGSEEATNSLLETLLVHKKEIKLEVMIKHKTLFYSRIDWIVWIDGLNAKHLIKRFFIVSIQCTCCLIHQDKPGLG